MTDLSATTAYGAAQFDDNFPAGIEDHFWFRARNAVLDRTLRQAENAGWVPPPDPPRSDAAPAS